MPAPELGHCSHDQSRQQRMRRVRTIDSREVHDVLQHGGRLGEATDCNEAPPTLKIEFGLQHQRGPRLSGTEAEHPLPSPLDDAQRRIEVLVQTVMARFQHGQHGHLVAGERKARVGQSAVQLRHHDAVEVGGGQQLSGVIGPEHPPGRIDPPCSTAGQGEDRVLRDHGLWNVEKSLNRFRNIHEDIDRPSRPPALQHLPIPDLQDKVEQPRQPFTTVHALAADGVGDSRAEGFAWSSLRGAVVDGGDAPHQDADEGGNGEDFGVAGSNGEQARRGQQRGETIGCGVIRDLPCAEGGLDKVNHGRGDLRRPREEGEQIECGRFAGGVADRRAQFRRQHRDSPVGVGIARGQSRFDSGLNQGVGDAGTAAAGAEDPLQLGCGERTAQFECRREVLRRGGSRSELHVKDRCGPVAVRRSVRIFGSFDLLR